MPHPLHHPLLSRPVRIDLVSDSLHRRTSCRLRRELAPRSGDDEASAGWTWLWRRSQKRRSLAALLMLLFHQPLTTWLQVQIAIHDGRNAAHHLFTCVAWSPQWPVDAQPQEHTSCSDPARLAVIAVSRHRLLPGKTVLTLP